MRNKTLEYQHTEKLGNAESKRNPGFLLVDEIYNCLMVIEHATVLLFLLGSSKGWKPWYPFNAICPFYTLMTF